MGRRRTVGRRGALSLQNWRTLMMLAAFWPSLAVADDQRGALDVTQNNIQQTICRRGWVRTVRPSAEFANAVKRRMMVEQGWENAADVELDHIVPLELGGAARDLKNLWLQPLRGPWNVHCKDALAVELSKTVCKGDAKLADAQDEIRRDWRTSYRGRIDPHGCESGAAASPK
jgi:hypothetical protein